jgi:hypothetical protein
MTWLRDGVPLSLLADLAPPGGPLSREILAVEALADDCAAIVPNLPRSRDAGPASGLERGSSEASAS